MKNKFSFYKNYIFFLKYKILLNVVISCSNKKFGFAFFFFFCQILQLSVQ